MAVPIVLSAEEAEDSYRSLDFLLEQLLVTLRQVLMLRRREAAANAPLQLNRHRHVPSEGRIADESRELGNVRQEATRISPEDIASSILPLPDVVLGTSSAPQEHKETDRATTTTTTTIPLQPSESMGQAHNWTQVGNDLKRMSDQLLSANRLDQMKNLVAKISLHAKICSKWCQLACANSFCRRLNCSCCCSFHV